MRLGGASSSRWPARSPSGCATICALLTYPIRVGTHFNTAFALVLSLEWAEQFDQALAAADPRASAHWFGNDRDCQAWEPGGDEFLSPALIEALCMARVPDGAGVPRLVRAASFRSSTRASRRPCSCPPIVSDRSDGKIAHLDGLNLSRAWCWRSLAPLLPCDEAQLADDTAEVHLEAAMPHVAGDYMGEHWLATFALLALSVLVALEAVERLQAAVAPPLRLAWRRAEPADLDGVAGTALRALRRR